jgi:hypothetical protein
MAKLLSANEFARQFKLHNCVDNPRFAAQVKAIQENVISATKEVIAFSNQKKVQKKS